MRQIFSILFFLCIILPVELYAETVQHQTAVPSNGDKVEIDQPTGVKVFIMPGQFIVKSNGETVILGESEKFKVKVKIKTHQVNIGS